MRRKQLNRKERRSLDRAMVRTEMYLRLAFESLQLTPEQIADAHTGYGENADMVSARLIELLELMHGGYSPENVATLKDLEQRRGVDFFARVAGMGRPAAAVLAEEAQRQGKLAWLRERADWLRERGAVLLLVLVALCWPSAAQARENAAKAVFETRIRYRRGNRQKLARFRPKAYHFRSWTRRKRSFGPSRQRSSCRWVSGTGCGRGHVRCDSRGLTSRSSLFGGAGAFASATSRAMTRISRSNCPTARSNARPTCEAR